MFESILSFAQCVNHRQRREMLNYISNPSSSPPRSSSLSRTGKRSSFYSNEQQLKKTSTENLHTFHKNRRNHVWFECDIALTANEVEKEKKNFQTRSKIQTFDFYFFRKNQNSSCESQTHADSPTFGPVSHQRQAQWIVVAGRKTTNLRLGIGWERRR